MPLVKTLFKDPPPWRSEKYRRWVSQFSCCLTDPAWFSNTLRKMGEVGKSDPHHEAPAGMKGMSTKPGDEHCVPVSHAIHVRMESPGNSRAGVWAKYGVDPEEVKRKLWELWKQKTGKYPGAI